MRGYITKSNIGKAANENGPNGKVSERPPGQTKPPVTPELRKKANWAASAFAGGGPSQPTSAWTVDGPVANTRTLCTSSWSTITRAEPKTDRKSTRLNSSHLGISY